MPDRLDHLGSPGRVLDGLRRASIAQSATAMADLYAETAVHEFPFTRPGLPSRLSGKPAIMEFIEEGWRSGPLRYESYETIVSYTTSDPSTVVVQQDVHGTSSTTGRFVLPNLMIITVEDDLIVHLRDFVNLPAAFEAMGLG